MYMVIAPRKTRKLCLTRKGAFRSADMLFDRYHKVKILTGFPFAWTPFYTRYDIKYGTPYLVE